VDYLKTIDSEPQFCVKIISSLPKTITEKYYDERTRSRYEIPLDSAHITRPVTTTGHLSSMMIQGAPQAGATKDTVNACDEQASKYELLGRPLNALLRVTVQYENSEYREEIPKIVFILTTFFRINKEHFLRQGLFRVNGDRSVIEELSIHL